MASPTASPSASPPASRSSGDGGGSIGRVSWDLVSSAMFVPLSASWVLMSSTPQPTRPLFLLPPFYRHLVFPPASLVLPLAALAFSRLAPDFASDLASSLPLASTLFAGFHHVPSDQTYKLALQFPSASHLFQFLETATNLGARSSLRLTHDLSHFLLSSPSDRNLHVDLDGNPGCTAHSTPLAGQETSDDCLVLWEKQGTPLATSRSPPSIAVQQNVTSEPEVYAPDSGNLDAGPNEPALKKRCNRVRTLLRLIRTTECPSIPPASSISLDSGGGCLGSPNDNALHRQMCYPGHVDSEVEDRQQSIPRCIEDELDNADDLDPSPMRASNLPEEQLLHQPGCESDTRAMEVIDTHASKDLSSGDLRSELLDCLLNPSFRLLVERVEDLLGEIDNPANIDLSAVAEFLTLRK